MATGGRTDGWHAGAREARAPRVALGLAFGVITLAKSLIR